MGKIEVGQPKLISDRKNIFFQCNDLFGDVWRLLGRIATVLDRDYPDKSYVADQISSTLNSIKVLPGKPDQVIYASSERETFSTNGTSIIGSDIVLPPGFINGSRSIVVEIDCRGQGVSPPQIQVAVSQYGKVSLESAFTVQGDCQFVARLTKDEQNVGLSVLVNRYGTSETFSRDVATEVVVDKDVTIGINAIITAPNYIRAYNVKVAATLY